MQMLANCIYPSLSYISIRDLLSLSTTFNWYAQEEITFSILKWFWLHHLNFFCSIQYLPKPYRRHHTCQVVINETPEFSVKPLLMKNAQVCVLAKKKFSVSFNILMYIEFILLVARYYECHLTIHIVGINTQWHYNGFTRLAWAGTATPRPKFSSMLRSSKIYRLFSCLMPAFGVSEFVWFS